MKILFEEYAYKNEDVEQFLNGFVDTCTLSDGRVNIPYVGYYFSQEVNDSVFILPKVFINVNNPQNEELAFGKFTPEEIIDTLNPGNPLRQKENAQIYDEIFNLSTWIYRAVAHYHERNLQEGISKEAALLNVVSIKGDKSQTFIDIILRLIRFSNEHRNLFTFIAKMNAKGNSNIHWQKTISKQVPILQSNTPIYLKFLTKSKHLNFDEELIVLFYSVLDYLHLTYNFKIRQDLNYQTDPKGVKRMVEKGTGTRYLRAIRRKYFKDELVELWNLLYVFFERAQLIAAKRYHDEKLLVRNFNMVFEDMIDAIVSDDTKEKTPKLKDQPDGKIVDHIFKYQTLLNPQENIYYIGDSKYYKEGHAVGSNSVYKQFTYARNVIQFNMDWFHANNNQLRQVYFDDTTEGYNITPNFFIRGRIDSDNINYHEEQLELEEGAETISHHPNRLFDRDTLIVLKYDINFLFVLSAYVSNHENMAFIERIQKKFRQNMRTYLLDHYDFYRLTPIRQSLEMAVSKHFKQLIGKVFRYDDTSIVLAWEKHVAGFGQLYMQISPDFNVQPQDILGAYYTNFNPYSNAAEN